MNGEKLNFCVYNFFGTRFGLFSSFGSIDNFVIFLKWKIFSKESFCLVNEL